MRTRGDMGDFRLVIVRVFNLHYCLCTDAAGQLRHFNMNCLEPADRPAPVLAKIRYWFSSLFSN